MEGTIGILYTYLMLPLPSTLHPHPRPHSLPSWFLVRYRKLSHWSALSRMGRQQWGPRIKKDIPHCANTPGSYMAASRHDPRLIPLGGPFVWFSPTSQRERRWSPFTGEQRHELQSDAWYCMHSEQF